MNVYVWTAPDGREVIVLAKSVSEARDITVREFDRFASVSHQRWLKEVVKAEPFVYNRSALISFKE